MKSFKFLAMAAFLAVVTSASAQFTNTTSSKSPSSSVGVNTDGWSTIWVEWNPSTMKYDSKDADDESFTGLSFGYSQAFSLTSSIPLFAEVGLGIQYSFYSDAYEDDKDDYTEEIKFNMVSAKVPANLMYLFQIPNSSISLIPYVGVNFRYNILAKEKWTVEGYYEDIEEEYNLFDKDDMGKDAKWNRFQLGWNIGAKARFGGKFLVSLSYGSDFSEIAKKTKISTTSISLGYTF